MRLRARHSALGFAARLGLALVITLAVVGAIGYSLVAGQLRQEQTASYASIVHADVQGFEAIGRTSRSTALALAQIDRLLDAVGHRSGVREAVLVDQSHTVRASGIVNGGIGVKASDPRIDAALLHGTTYSGHEADPRRNPKDFEFVVPSSFGAAVMRWRSAMTIGSWTRSSPPCAGRWRWWGCWRWSLVRWCSTWWVAARWCAATATRSYARRATG